MARKSAEKKILVQLEAGDCRWPIGDPRQAHFHFCGAQQVIGRPYCKEHQSQSCDAVKSSHRPSTPFMSSRRAA